MAKLMLIPPQYSWASQHWPKADISPIFMGQPISTQNGYTLLKGCPEHPLKYNWLLHYLLVIEMKQHLYSEYKGNFFNIHGPADVGLEQRHILQNSYC
jgi:hypothetical protein